MAKSSKPNNVVKIKLSIPILARTKCKFCFKLPNFYYVISNGLLDISPKRINSIYAKLNSHFLSFNPSYYLDGDPKNFRSLSDFSHSTFYKNFRPSLHRLIKEKRNKFSNVHEIITCDCGRSQWLITDKSMEHRPDILNRKSSKSFDHIFNY